MKIFFSVGEPSGDIHGANLIRDLRQRIPDVECVGYGGPAMEAAGCQLHADLTELAVMWLFTVVKNIHRFLRLVREADRYFRNHRPDAVVMIDYPGFNWWIARRAKNHKIPVFYYGTPQLWAWAPWRVKKMRRLVDHILCKLPFEPEWYRQRGCQATYVGHPFFDEVARKEIDRAFVAEQARRDGRLVTILPGSRTAEVTNNLPWLLKAAAHIQEQVADVRFEIASYKDSQAQLARQIIAHQPRAADLSIDLHVGRTSELIEAAECCMAVSGSVSLELMQRTTPTVILYWMDRLTVFMMGRVLGMKIKFITLVNLMSVDEPFDDNPQPFDPDAPGAEAVPMPEYPTCEDKSEQVARHIIEWLRDEDVRQMKIGQLAALKAKYGKTGASERAADYIAAALRELPGRSLPAPHFIPGRTSAAVAQAGRDAS
ncbi:MAG: lipid-A-disaccharide synthase [Planctomycetota bacterium]|nr:MAG: lipid-A-disaccharide synthase [Planctomycetota bacterium]REJ91372.1 MAG: lipid-A-disaccharide synthase [Planctomycetota bacterium]